MLAHALEEFQDQGTALYQLLKPALLIDGIKWSTPPTTTASIDEIKVVFVDDKVCFQVTTSRTAIGAVSLAGLAAHFTPPEPTTIEVAAVGRETP